MIRKFNAPIISRRKIAENTSEISFDTTQADFEFLAGQYITVTLPGLGALPTRAQFRDFSIASPPYERQRISIAFRHSDSPFKKILLSGDTHNEVEIEGPKGIFTLPKDADTHIVFIAGGIGVTPFYSMLRQAVHDGLAYPITLLYYNSNRMRAAYFDELHELCSKSDSLTFVPIFGPVDREQIRQQTTEKPPSAWFIAGPPRMVSSARRLLIYNNVDDATIKIEEFTGYA